MYNYPTQNKEVRRAKCQVTTMSVSIAAQEVTLRPRRCRSLNGQSQPWDTSSRDCTGAMTKTKYLTCSASVYRWESLQCGCCATYVAYRCEKYAEGGDYRCLVGFF